MPDMKMGRTLSKERWKSAAEAIEKIAPIIAEQLRKTNYEGQGKRDAEEFANDMLLAYTALRYVAEFATDKCRFTTFEEGKVN